MEEDSGYVCMYKADNYFNSQGASLTRGPLSTQMSRWIHEDVFSVYMYIKDQ